MTTTFCVLQVYQYQQQHGLAAIVLSDALELLWVGVALWSELMNCSTLLEEALLVSQLSNLSWISLPPFLSSSPSLTPPSLLPSLLSHPSLPPFLLHTPHSQYMFMVLFTAFLVTCLKFNNLWVDTIPYMVNNKTRQRDVNISDIIDTSRLDQWVDVPCSSTVHLIPSLLCVHLICSLSVKFPVSFPVSFPVCHVPNLIPSLSVWLSLSLSHVFLKKSVLCMCVC